MQQMVTKTAVAAGQITHAVKSRAESNGGVKGTLMQLGKQKLADTSFFKAYAGAQHNMESWKNARGSTNPFKAYQSTANDSNGSQSNKAPNNSMKNGKKR